MILGTYVSAILVYVVEREIENELKAYIFWKKEALCLYSTNKYRENINTGGGVYLYTDNIV